jgi:AraC-like DNA-binding protein
LSGEDSYNISYIDPPPKLAHLITTFFKFSSDQSWLRDVQPAATGYMMAFIQGQGQARFSDGTIAPSKPISLIGPTNAAMQYVLKGPVITIGCAFTPIGWRAVTGVPADECSDHLHDACEFHGDAANLLFQNLCDINASGSSDVQTDKMTDLIVNYLLDHIHPVPIKHMQLVSAVAQWLDSSLTPDLETLYDQLPVAKRQAQRLIGSYFGCAPKPLMRKYRAFRSAMILNDPNCSAEDIEQVHDLFYDQPHMIREIRHFVGRTPSRISGADHSLLSMWLDRDNIRELR